MRSPHKQLKFAFEFLISRLSHILDLRMQLTSGQSNLSAQRLTSNLQMMLLRTWKVRL